MHLIVVVASIDCVVPEVALDLWQDGGNCGNERSHVHFVAESGIHRFARVGQDEIVLSDPVQLVQTL